MPRQDGSPRRFRTSTRLFAVGAVVVTTLGLCASFAFHAMFSFFASYDDEGAMLIVLDQLARGHTLYDQVVSMYGPLGFLPKLAIIKLFGLTVTHDLGRSWTLAYWLAASAALGVAAWRLGRSIAWFGVGTVAVCFSLMPIRQEPGHPQDFCALILSIAVAASMSVGGRKTNWIIVLLGSLGGLLTMTKINLGAFYMMALAATQIFHLRDGVCRHWLRPILVAVLLCFPLILMRGYLSSEWAVLYAVRTVLSLAACLLIAWRASLGRDFAFSQLLLGTGSFAASVLVTCAATFAMGTSVNGLLDAVWFLPWRLYKSFSRPLPAVGWALPATVVGLVIALLVSRWLAAEAVKSRSIPVFIGVLRVAVGLSGLLLALSGDSITVLNSAPAFAWLLLCPVRSRPNDFDHGWARMFLAFLAVLESMWAFPVAGSQLVLSGFLLVTAAVVTLADGIRDLTASVPRGKTARLLRELTAVAILCVVLLRGLAIERDAAATYHSLTSLDLPGSDWIRLDPRQVLSYRTQVANLRENADMMFTLPGLNSLYFWAQMPPPTPANVTDWMYILNHNQQDQIVHVLDQHPRACVLVHPEEVRFWRGGLPVVEGPLLRYLTTRFRVALRSSDGWQLMVRKERPSVVVVGHDGTRQVFNLTRNDR